MVKLSKIQKVLLSPRRHDNGERSEKESLPEGTAPMVTLSSCCLPPRRRRTKMKSSAKPQTQQGSEQLISHSQQSLLATRVVTASSVVDRSTGANNKSYPILDSNVDRKSHSSEAGATGNATVISTRKSSNQSKVISVPHRKHEEPPSTSNPIGIGKMMMKRVAKLRPKPTAGDKTNNGMDATNSSSRVVMLKDDDPSVIRMYDSIPLMEVTMLPRGGISIATEAVGQVQVRNLSVWLCLELVLTLYIYCYGSNHAITSFFYLLSVITSYFSFTVRNTA